MKSSLEPELSCQTSLFSGGDFQVFVCCLTGFQPKICFYPLCRPSSPVGSYLKRSQEHQDPHWQSRKYATRTTKIAQKFSHLKWPSINDLTSTLAMLFLRSDHAHAPAPSHPPKSIFPSQSALISGKSITSRGQSPPS